MREKEHKIMAKVTINPAVTVVSPVTYTLELNEQEFTALMVLVGMVGGKPEGIRNDVLNPLWKSVFEQKFMDDSAFGQRELYNNYRNQIKGEIYV